MAIKKTEGYKSDILNHEPVQLRDLGVGLLSPRNFSTGSVGFNHSGKVSVKCDNATYNCQVSLNVTMPYSKEGHPKRPSDEVLAAFLAGPPVTLKDLGLQHAVADARQFNSGKVGFYFNGKAQYAGKSYQVGCSITCIGSEDWDETRPLAEPEA